MNQHVIKERKRISGIEDVFQNYPEMSDIRKKAIDKGVDAGEAAKMLAKELGTDQEPGSGHVEVSSNVIEGIKAAMQVKAGLAKPEQGNDFQRMSLIELANRTLETNGMNTKDRSPMEIARMATHSTSDFPLIMGDTVNKSVLLGWEEKDDTSYLQFVSTGTVSDFKVTTRAGVLDFSDLELVPEGDEYTYGTLGENSAQIKVAKYGKKFSMTWEAMVNDNLGEFTKTAQRMGAAARRNESRLVYSIFNDNPTLKDGTALFHADHGNIAATPGAPSEALFEEIITAMSTQQRNNIDIFVNPTYYLGPVKHRFDVSRLLETSARPGATNNEINVFEGIVKPIHTNRLSGNAWYILADNGDTIEVTHLKGYEQPETFENVTDDIDGIEYKVRHVTAATALDYPGMFRNDG